MAIQPIGKQLLLYINKDEKILDLFFTIIDN